MKLSHVTLRDDNLPHQVVIYSVGTSVNVSCNCRRIPSDNPGFPTYESMGISNSIQDSRDLYDNPENHSIEFTEGDRAKW